MISHLLTDDKPKDEKRFVIEHEGKCYRYWKESKRLEVMEKGKDRWKEIKGKNKTIILTKLGIDI